MKKLNKKDIIYIILSIIIFLLIIVFISNQDFLYSTSLLNSQTTIIEYFRTLYYNTLNLFPDYALNIENGINIYQLTEYGFLSPIILLSYLLPFLSIQNYLFIIVIISTILSIILIYNFFKKKKLSSEVCFLITLILTTSSSIIFNTYNNPLIISYLPFLLLSYYGVDKVIDDKKSYLLIISTFFMITTNPLNSIFGIISLIIYTLYRYLNKMNTITIKSIFKHFISVIIPIIIGALCSSILIIPSLINNNLPALQTTLTIDINNILYGTAGLGLTALLIPSIISYFKKDKTNIIIGTILCIITILSITNNIPSNYIISFIMLYLIIISEFLTNIINKKLRIIPILIGTLIVSSILFIINYNQTKLTIEILLLIISIYLYYKTSKKQILIIPISLFIIINTYNINQNNLHIPTKTYSYEQSIISSSINNITSKDNTFYRIYNDTNTNILNNIKYNTPSNNGILSLLLNNTKYIISKNNSLQGYEKISENNEYKIYKNESTLPLGFATSNIMSYEDYSKLNNLVKQEALLNVIVADEKSHNDFISSIQKIDIDYQEILNNKDIIFTQDSIIINIKETTKITYELPDKYKNKIIYLNFKVTNGKSKVIKINNVSKEITSNEEKLSYELANQEQSSLVFTLEKGQYILSELETFILDYANIENYSNQLDPFIVDSINTKGDTIIGTINVTEDSYFLMTIPYDSGFKVLLDNEKISYEKVDDMYIGFKIPKGFHAIEIEYTPPSKLISYLLTILGILSSISIIYLESKRKFN